MNMLKIECSEGGVPQRVVYLDSQYSFFVRHASASGLASGLVPPLRGGEGGLHG